MVRSHESTPCLMTKLNNKENFSGDKYIPWKK